MCGKDGDAEIAGTYTLIVKGEIMLDRKAILAAVDIQTETVEVPEWRGSVMVRGLTGAGRDAWQESMLQGSGRSQKVRLAEATVRLVQLSVIDGTGNLLFKPEDIPALNKKSAAALNRIYEVAARLSGLTPEDVEEMAKNSESLSRTAASTSDSPAI
jgi:hypothetical protein